MFPYFFELVGTSYVLSYRRNSGCEEMVFDN